MNGSCCSLGYSHLEYHVIFENGVKVMRVMQNEPKCYYMVLLSLFVFFKIIMLMEIYYSHALVL